MLINFNSLQIFVLVAYQNKLLLMYQSYLMYWRFNLLFVNHCIFALYNNIFTIFFYKPKSYFVNFYVFT